MQPKHVKQDTIVDTNGDKASQVNLTGINSPPINTNMNPLALLKPPAYLDPEVIRERKKQASDNTSGADQSLSKVGMLQVAKLAGNALSYYWETQRKSVIAVSSMSAIGALVGLIPAVANAWYAQAVTSALETSATGTTVALLGTIVGIAAVQKVIYNINEAINLRVNHKLLMNAKNELTSHTMLLSFDNAISDKNADKTQSVFQNTWEHIALFSSGSNISLGLAQAALATGYLCFQSPVSAIALACSCVPGLVFSFVRSSERYSMQQSFLLVTRLGWMRDWLLGSPKDTATFRRLGEVESLQGMRDEVVEMVHEADKRINNRQFLSSLKASIIEYGTIAVTGSILLYQDIALASDISSALAHTAIILSVGLGVSNLVSGISSCSKNLMILKPFFDFVKENKELRNRKTEIKEIALNDKPPIIRISELSYKVDSKIVINNISLSIKPGEILGICGPSGQGKSTLIKLIAGLIKPTNGQIIIGTEDEQYDLTSGQYDFDSLLRQLAIQMQDDSLMHGFTIGNNLKFGAKDNRVEPSELLDIVDVSKLLKHMGAVDTNVMIGDGWFQGLKPSGGEEKKLLLYRYMSSGKPVLILDEPLQGIDTVVAASMQKAIIQFARKKAITLIFITHGTADLVDADRILVIDEGKIVDQGTSGELLERKGFYRDAVLTGLGKSLETLESSPAYIIKREPKRVIIEFPND